MRILFISSHALFKGTRFGGTKRLYYLARELDRRTDMHLLCLDGCRELPARGCVPREFRKQLFLPLDTARAWWRKAAFLPGVAEVIARRRPSIEAFLGEGAFDATLMAYPHSLCFLEWGWTSRMGKLVYMEDDLIVESYRRDAAGGKTGLLRLARLLRYKQALAFFRRELAKVDTFVCISNEEEKVTRDLYPGLPTVVLKYGLPLEEYPYLPAPEERTVLGFIGNYRHPPNLDAVSWLVEELFPFLYEGLPDARLLLGGRDVPEDIKAKCARNSAIRLWEDVEDLAQFYGSIGIFINPVRQGRGLRTKVVEAAAFGRPILSTALGAEGLEDLQLRLCETKEQFLEALRTLVGNEEYHRAAEHNRQAIVRGFSAAKVGETLTEILAAAPSRASRFAMRPLHAGHQSRHPS
jgi:glycosyltransferase involved in cell wall biosynthesis